MLHIKAEGFRQGWRIAVAFCLSAGVALGCAKDPPRMTTGPVDAASIDHITVGSDLLTGGPDVPIGGGPDIPADTQPTPPADVMFPNQPQITCATVSDCEFPPSACAAPSCDGGLCPGFSWVVYYDSPQCVAGQCVFEQRYFQCANGLSCNLGGCRFNGTFVAVP